ncbi:MAG TPA: hypothetical protein VGG57_16645 [Stellaceae bacterium]|jgi:hypothetical protein
MRLGWGAALLLAVAGIAGAAAAAPRNELSEQLERMRPAERAAKLAQIVGFWCVGTQAFLMGVAQSGEEAGNAYWSVACLNGTSYAIQIDPLGRPVTVPCSVLADTGKGKECFKKF